MAATPTQFRFRRYVLLAAISSISSILGGAAICCAEASQPPADFPSFVVPGQEREMDAVRQLFWLHYAPAGPLIPLWDEWMPKATLWPALGAGTPTTDVAASTDALNSMRRRWREALSGRTLNAEGYVHTRQHDGPAHAEGWPFPFWMHAGGVGWHFAPIGIGGYEAPAATDAGWQVVGGENGGVAAQGWSVSLAERDGAIISPPFAIDAALSPWLRLNWRAAGLNRAPCVVEWTTSESPEFSSARRIEFAPAEECPLAGEQVDASSIETRTMMALYRHPEWRGTITRLRLQFAHDGPAKLLFKSIHTAVDTRHNVNNLNFIRGCRDYFMWTGDTAFLREQIERIRIAMRFVEREFQTRERKCIFTTWPGHEGRSGVRVVDGVKTIVPGAGIGSNYWDLLPFGGEDALATVYYYDALQDLAELEEAAAKLGISSPVGGVSDAEAARAGQAKSAAETPPTQTLTDPAAPYDPADLRRHAEEVKAFGGERFWNAATGRFGTRDLDGVLHDYGFTFLNNEAVYLDFATAEQAQAIDAWIGGERTVAGDTSTGADIYHWRFGPRSTTRRNVDYYVWNWSAPESIPWGSQVQDGGAVLGWSYHDLMARLKTSGPDAAAARLAEIADWFEEVEGEGGYRAYYAKDPVRGTMQGGNVAGGLGLDHEFFESVLVPQVMLYGFLGFQPTADGFEVHPRLPQDWPELTVTGIYVRDQIIDVTGRADGTYEVNERSPK